MSQLKYDIHNLMEISLIDAEVALKKAGSDEKLCDWASDCAEGAGSFLEKYDNDGIIAKHKDFLEDIGRLKEMLEKLYVTAAIWDADELVKAFISGNREHIYEKFDNLKICLESLTNKLRLAETDESGKLKNSPDEVEDEELIAQPECGKIVKGNYAPVEVLNKIAKLVDELDFDAATVLAKKVGSVFYSESFNIEVKKLIWIMRMGEFEKADESAKKIIELAEEHNKAVDERAEDAKPRVLVVDDVTDMLLTVKGILYDLCHVCTVTNYISALRFLENCHADLIILDIGLPEMDGFAMLKRIRTMDNYKKTPVMFLTGDVSKDTILRAIDAGISDYLRKPIDAGLLISRLQKHLKIDAAEV